MSMELTPRGGAEIDMDMRCNLAQEKYCPTHSSAILEYHIDIDIDMCVCVSS